MCAATSASDDTIVLNGIDRDTFANIAAAFGECHPRLTFDHGRLEMWAVIPGLSWENYLRFLEAIGDISLRHTYVEGVLEMMSPRKDHDWIKRIIGRFIEAMTLDLNILIQSIGSTTLASDDFECSLQPDEAYYVRNESRVRGKLEYSPQNDPPPDLVVEVDVTSSSVKRLPSYWAIGVEEVWRHDGKRLFFLRRTDDSSYVEISNSLAFPFLSSDDVNAAMQEVTKVNENELVRAFVGNARIRWAEFQKKSAE
ncbi:MAG: Uma2 family endonuclease [Planctomycetia bacterium]|nr:Uma2 family endonuclease [Planctomycetia bacterium]